MRKPPRAPQPEETHERTLSSRDEGLLFLHGLESNTEHEFDFGLAVEFLESGWGEGLLGSQLT